MIFVLLNLPQYHSLTILDSFLPPLVSSVFLGPTNKHVLLIFQIVKPRPGRNLLQFSKAYVRVNLPTFHVLNKVSLKVEICRSFATL